MKTARTLAATALMLVTQACSTAPRTFVPTVTASAGGPTDAAAIQAATDRCRQLVAAGRTADFAGAAVSTGAGVGAGAATVSAAAPAILLGGSVLGVLGAATGVGALAAFGVSRLIRATREDDQRHAMERCLAESHLTATAWREADD